MNTTYRVSWHSMGFLLKLFLIVLFPLELTCGLCLFSFLATSLTEENLLIVSIVGIISIVITPIVISLIYTAGTFLKFSPEGLEYHRWPFTTITCRWSEAEKIVQSNVIGMSVATLMIPREKIGWEIPIEGGVLGSAKYKLVPISDFQGWPDGELMSELKNYAPNLFFYENYVDQSNKIYHVRIKT